MNKMVYCEGGNEQAGAIGGNEQDSQCVRMGMLTRADVEITVEGPYAWSVPASLITHLLCQVGPLPLNPVSLPLQIIAHVR